MTKKGTRSAGDGQPSDLTAVSLFSGAGGFCAGVQLAGYKVRCAVEADRDACRTFSANFPHVPLFGEDIRGFLKEDRQGVPTLDELAEQEIDLVYGGPPCQGFSQIGPRDLQDPRNLLYREFARIVEALTPRAFIMENVPNMVAMRNGHYRDQILKSFQQSGYLRTAIVTLLASDYGVPQDRRRVFFIGLRDGLPLEASLEDACLELMSKQKCKQSVTVREAISDLPASVSENDGPLRYPKW